MEQWACPSCGNTFVTPRMAHSCVVVDLAEHFPPRPGDGAQTQIPALFDAYVAFVERHGGPVKVIPQRTRIALQSRIRFGSVVVRRDWLDVALWLKQRAEHPRLRKVDDLGKAGFYHWFRLTDPDQLDDALGALISVAYRM